MKLKDQGIHISNLSTCKANCKIKLSKHFRKFIFDLNHFQYCNIRHLKSIGIDFASRKVCIVSTMNQCCRNVPSSYPYFVALF